jgi:DNA invertase Pin-like site-specific DNA recombinase
MTMLGYLRVSKHDGSQVLDLQRDAVVAAGVDPKHLYEEMASGRHDDRPVLGACLKALRPGDCLVVWKLDRLGRSLRHLVNTVHDLAAQGIGVKVLTGEGGLLDTTTASGKLMFNMFAALAEFEADLIRERTLAGLAAARARGRKGGRPYRLTGTRQALAAAGMADRSRSVRELATDLGVSPSTLYRVHRRHQQRKVQDELLEAAD